MSRIVHLALKVEDLEHTTEFYQNVSASVKSNTEKTRDHMSRHLSDGEIDFTLIKYDAGTQSAESKASGAGPCIHHFARRSRRRREVRRRADQVLRLRHHQRSRRDSGQIPRARRHHLRESCPWAVTRSRKAISRDQG